MIQLWKPLIGPLPAKRKANTLAQLLTYQPAKRLCLMPPMPKIAPLLAQRGYTAELIAEKLTELHTLNDLIADQKRKYGEQYATTQAYAEAMTALHKRYIDHLALARIVLKDTAGQLTLGLKGARCRTESAYCSQALLFYNGLLNDDTYRAAMHKLGIDTDELNTSKTDYETLSKKAGDKAQKTGEARAATHARDQAFDAFAHWFSDFKKIAYVALSKNAQLCEKLGWKA